MSGPKVIFYLLLAAVLIGIGWYGWIFLKTIEPDVTPTLGTKEQIENINYNLCVKAATEEYLINSDNGINDPSQLYLRIKEQKVQECKRQYNRQN